MPASREAQPIMASRTPACYDRSVSNAGERGQPLVAILRERSGEILATWIARFERSALRFRRATKSATYTAQVSNLVEALAVASHTNTELRPGSDATRELERSAAFLGAQFAAEG